MVKTSPQRYDVSSHGKQARQECVLKELCTKLCLLGDLRKKQVSLCK